METTFEKVDDSTFKMIETKTSETEISIFDILSTRELLIRDKETLEARIAEIDLQIVEAQRLGIEIPSVT